MAIKGAEFSHLLHISWRIPQVWRNPLFFLWIKSKIAKDHVVEKGNSVQTWLFWVSTVDVSSAYYISYSDIQCIIIQ